MRIAFNPSTVAALTTPPNNKDITFDLRGRNIFARGVEFKGTDTWRPVVDNLTSDSTTSSLSAKQGKTLKALIDGKSNSGHNHDDRYLKLTGGTMQLGEGLKFHADENYFGTYSDARIISLLDDNDKVCDGGLIIDERGTLDGKEYVTELLRIRDSEFKWKGSNILHSGNSYINGSTITINGSSLSVIDQKVTQTSVSSGYTDFRAVLITAETSSASAGYTPSTVIGKTFITNALQLSPQAGNLYLKGSAAIGTTNFNRKLNVNGDIGLLNVGSIKDLAIGGGIYWNPYVESSTDSSDAASITVVKSGVAGGTTLVLSQMNNSNDTIQFKTSGSARLYHNSYPILTTQNTYVNNNKGYINGIEITQVNNARGAYIATLTLDIDTLVRSGYLASDYTSRYNTQEFMKAGAKYLQKNYSGQSVFGTMHPNAQGFFTANIYSSGFNSNGNPEHITIHYYNYGGGTINCGTSYGNWYYYNISNNGTASKLETARKLWGQSFDGTADVSGTLSGVANIQFSANNAYDIGSNGNASRYIYTHWLGSKSGANLRLAANNSDNQIVLHTNGNVGIGTNSPSYKLQVNGDIHVSHATSNNMNYNTSNPRIIFSENGTQAVGLVYTDFDSYRASKGLKVMDVDNSDTSNVWLEVQGYNYSRGYVKNGSSDAYVLLGGGGHKAESSLNVANADKVDGVHVTWAGELTSTNHLVAWESNGSALRDIKPANVSVGNSDKLDGIHASSGNNKPWGTIPAITTSGFMDIGKHLEFHYDNSTGSDYSTALMCQGNYSNIVYLPSSSGTLALTSQVLTWKSQIIDMRNYSESYWHPVTVNLPYTGYNKIKVSVQLNSGDKPSWATHSSGITCNMEIWATASGWGTTGAETICLNYTYAHCSQNPCGWMQLGYPSLGILFLRGGSRYRVYTDFDATFTPHDQKYTWTSGSYSQNTGGPYTNCPGLNFNKNKIYANLDGYASHLEGGSTPGWGTLTAANGFTNVSSYDYGSRGAYGLCGKNSTLYMQLDGYFYQNEGRYRVLDTSDLSSVTNHIMVSQYTTGDTNYPLVWSNQSNTSSAVGNQLYKSWADLYYNPKNKRLYTNRYVGSYANLTQTSMRHIDADLNSKNTDHTLYIGYGAQTYTAGTNIYASTGSGDTTSARYLLAQFNTEAGINLNSNINTRPSIIFRNETSYKTTLSYATAGNEALCFETKSSVTSIIFYNGATYSNSSSHWQDLINGVQIKNNCLAIGAGWANGVNPNYKLKVGGNGYFTDHVIARSSDSSWLDGQRYNQAGYNLQDVSSTGNYYPWMRQTNTGSAKWFSIGILNNSFYILGSKTSRTENSYDYAWRFDLSNGWAYGNFSNADTVDGVHLDFSGSLTYDQYSWLAAWTKDGKKIKAVHKTHFARASHSHSWISITDKIVAGNEFNIVNAGFKAGMWFNYLPINNRDSTAAVQGYHFGNGAKGYTSVTASSFIKSGSSSSYVLLGDGSHKTISSLSVNYANSAGSATKASYVTLTYCRDDSSPSNKGLWNTIKNGTSSAQTNKVNFYTIYNSAGGPSGHGEMMEILSCNANHWQPQLWFGAGKTGGIYYRNKSYNDNTWGSWQTVAFTSQLKDPENYYWANVKISASSSTGTSPTFNTAYTSNWFRSNGTTGWYSQTYGGGIYMADTTWIRAYGNKGIVAKNFYASNWASATYLLRSDGGAAAFNWSGQSGQPTWLWGGNSQHSYYVYNPSNFSVKYAASAGAVAWGNITGKPSTFTPSSHTHTYIVAEDLRSRYPGQILDPQRMKLSFLAASTLGIKNDGTYYDAITVRSYADSSGGSDNALLFSKNTNSLYHTRFAFGSTSSWGSPLLIIDSGNIGSQSVAYASKAGSVAWSNVTGRPSSLKNPYSLNVFGVAYDGSAAKTVTTSTFISQVSEATSTITDGTMLITSYASNSGFADTNAVNVPYKRKAVHLWDYIDGKVSTKYLPLAGGTMNANARISHGNGNLYIGRADNNGWVYTQDIASHAGTDKWSIRTSGAASFGSIHIASKTDASFNSNVIECGSSIHLNYFSSQNVGLCNGGGCTIVGPYTTGDTGNNKLFVNGSEFIDGNSNVRQHVFANGFRHRSHNSDDAVLLAGGGYSQGVPVKYWSIEEITIYGSKHTARTYKGGNYTFITSISPRRDGSCTLTLQFPSGYNYENTMIWAMGRLNLNSPDSSSATIYASIVHGMESKYYLNLANDSSLDNGSCMLYFMCF